MGFFTFRRRTMNQQLNTRNVTGARRRAVLNPVALTALVYLREALLEERYEDCPQILQVAREFNVPEVRILWLLEDPRRTVLA